MNPPRNRAPGPAHRHPALLAAALVLVLGGCLLVDHLAAGGSASETTNKSAGRREKSDPHGGTTRVTVPQAGPDPVDAWTWRLNTTATGAAVAGDQVGFPLLLRLDSAGFDFSRVGEGGAGIAFRKADGTPLAFAIERWDSLGRRAEIWVRMDTVKGNSDRQSLRMEVIRGLPGPLPEGPGVFAPADGFAGVWHLGAVVGDKPDATGNGHWARPVYYGGSDTVEGQVGPGERLDSLNSYLDAGVIQPGPALTLSAWIRPDAGSPWSAVIQKHLPSAFDPASLDPWRMSYGLLATGSGDSLGFTGSDGSYQGLLLAPAPSVPETWSLIAATWDGGTFTLYRDGKRVAAHEAGLAGPLEANGEPTLIGGYSLPTAMFRYSRFSGLIDEVRIESAARSEDWIRLAYENQKTGQRLVRRAP